MADRSTDLSQGAIGAGLFVDPGTLDRLLGNLQGNGPKIGADAGLGRLSEARLWHIRQAAEARVLGCMQALRSVSSLVMAALNRQDESISGTDLFLAVTHMSQLSEDLERWHQLADHAQLYRTRRDIAQEVTLRWVQSARGSGGVAGGADGSGGMSERLWGRSAQRLQRHDVSCSDNFVEWKACVMAAPAGVQFWLGYEASRNPHDWTPAFAGMTNSTEYVANFRNTSARGIIRCSSVGRFMEALQGLAGAF